MLGDVGANGRGDEAPSLFTRLRCAGGASLDCSSEDKSSDFVLPFRLERLDLVDAADSNQKYIKWLQTHCKYACMYNK